MSFTSINVTRKPLRILSCVLFTVGLFLLVVSHRITKTFCGNVSIGQILFHLQIPAEYVDSKVILSIIDPTAKTVVISFICIVIFWSFTFGMFDFIPRCFTWSLLNTLYKTFKKTNFLISFSLAVFLVCMAIVAYKHRVIDYILSQGKYSTIIDEHYVKPDLDSFKQNGLPLSAYQSGNNNKQPNLVFVISESLEYTFSQKAYWDRDLIPCLHELANTNDLFLSITSVEGTQFTIGAMYSFFYGLPLMYMRLVNGDPVSDNIFKNQTSTFDILNQFGYSIVYMQGSDLRFAAKDQLFCNVKSPELIGWNTIDQTVYENKKQTWGLYDSDLFELARSKYTSLSELKKPFALILLTVDPHFGNDVEPGHGANYGDMRDLIIYQDELIGNFVKWIKNQENSEDTVIVVTGDHFLMADKIANYAFKNMERSVYSCIINSKAPQKTTEKRQAAVWDLAPTFLEALGFSWDSHRFGLGTSLYTTEKTMLEQVGIETWNNESFRLSKKYIELISPDSNAQEKNIAPSE